METQFLKSYCNKDNPLIDYCTKHSVKMTEVQKKLHDYTMANVESSMMIGAPEAVQLNMHLLRLIKAKRVLDVGVFTGYSALSAALAIPDDGKVIGLDVNEDTAQIAKGYFKEAKVDHKIQIIIQPALQTLDSLIAKGEAGTFDFAFIDADKVNYRKYYERCLTLLRVGGIIAIDNVLWNGKVLRADSDKDEDTVAISQLNDFISTDERVDSNMLLLGDGLTICIKL